VSYDDDSLTEALVRAAYRDDWSLDRLLKFADKGFAATISLLVNGRWIEGVLSRPEEWADKVDADIDEGFGGAVERATAEQSGVTDPRDLPTSKSTVGDLEESRASLRDNSFRSMVDERRAAEEALIAAVDALQESDVPSDEMKRELEALTDPAPVISLREVVIEGGAGVNARHVPMLRVLREHVAAWHMGRASAYEGP